MIKVCHIISGDLWAGAEVMAYHLLRGLLKYDDLRLSAILLNSGRLADEMYGLGIPVKIYDERKFSHVKLVWQIRKSISKEKPDIIHSHRYKENILAYLSSRTIRKSKLISTRHGLPEVNRAGSSLKKEFLSRIDSFLLTRCFHAVVAVSQEVKKFLTKEGCSQEKVKLIHNGIEIPDNSHRPKRNEKFVIGSAGRFFPVKDYPLMIEIAKAVSQRGGNIIFRLAGEGPERDTIVSLIKQYRLEMIFQLEGTIHNMSQFYEGLDLYLNTSVHEGIPMSVLEAMSYGLPIVAPLVGGLPEIIQDGVQGFLLGNRNPQDFAERCLWLYEDMQLRNRMGDAARERVEKNFSIEKMASQYYKLYQDISAA